MFLLEFKNEKDFDITFKNLNFELLSLIATNEEFFNTVSKEKYYKFAEYEKIKFDKYTFLIVKNNRKQIEMILLND